MSIVLLVVAIGVAKGEQESCVKGCAVVLFDVVELQLVMVGYMLRTADFKAADKRIKHLVKDELFIESVVGKGADVWTSALAEGNAEKLDFILIGLEFGADEISLEGLIGANLIELLHGGERREGSVCGLGHCLGCGAGCEHKCDSEGNTT